jgi:hypothetical protein
MVFPWCSRTNLRGLQTLWWQRQRSFTRCHWCSRVQLQERQECASTNSTCAGEPICRVIFEEEERHAKRESEENIWVLWYSRRSYPYVEEILSEERFRGDDSFDNVTWQRCRLGISELVPCSRARGDEGILCGREEIIAKSCLADPTCANIFDYCSFFKCSSCDGSHTYRGGIDFCFFFRLCPTDMSPMYP